jgi:hypothetical protein
VRAVNLRLLPTLLAISLLAACTGRENSTPLPTKQTAIDPVVKKLDAAAQEEQKRREEMDAAASK